MFDMSIRIVSWNVRGLNVEKINSAASIEAMEGRSCVPSRNKITEYDSKYIKELMGRSSCRLVICWV